MDQRERHTDLLELLLVAFEHGESAIWTAMPAVIESVKLTEADGWTVEAQPTINCRFPNPDGTYTWHQPPLCTDVPICFQGGGGVTFTFPVAQGDECLLIVSSRCIDTWFANGFQDPVNAGVNEANNPPDLRMHDLSDCLAIVGLRSKPRCFDASLTTARLTTDDGSCYWELNPTSKVIKAVAPGGLNLNGVLIDSSGNLTSPATVTGQTNVVAGTGGTSVELHGHEHPANNSPPTPGS